MDNNNTPDSQLDRRTQDWHDKLNDLKETIVVLSTKFALVEYKTNQMLWAMAFLGTSITAIVISEVATRLKTKTTSNLPVIELIRDA